jgi:hypothetical protein
MGGRRVQKVFWFRDGGMGMRHKAGRLPRRRHPRSRWVTEQPRTKPRGEQLDENPEGSKRSAMEGNVEPINKMEEPAGR